MEKIQELLLDKLELECLAREQLNMELNEFEHQILNPGSDSRRSQRSRIMLKLNWDMGGDLHFRLIRKHLRYTPSEFEAMMNFMHSYLKKAFGIENVIRMDEGEVYLFVEWKF